LSVVLTYLAICFAVRMGFVSKPVKERFATRIVPLGGGIGIFTTLAIVLLGAMAVVTYLVAPGRVSWLDKSVTDYATGFINQIGKVLIVLLLAFVLFLLGLWDDKKRLGPYIKLVVQLGVAITAAGFADIRVKFFIENYYITVLLSAIWIVVIVNAFNFLDNMDGLSAGIAVITSSILFVAAAASGQVFIGAFAIAFVGTLLGFLVFNFPPAKIYMGDAGSLVVGFFVALLTLRTTYYNQAMSQRWYPVFVPLIVMAVPMYDFLSVTILRISQGKSPFVGDTQHFSHRLKKRGLSETQTILTLYLATLCTALGATFLYQVDSAGAVLIFVQTVMVLLIIAIFETTAGNGKNSQ
jgi:UDP-GlcNAc:undecaprenyl-phosphate/decaprenyl-phosphate GlcNAc-1-phosphate transferase